MTDSLKAEDAPDLYALLGRIDELYDATTDVEPDPMDPVHSRAEELAKALGAERDRYRRALERIADLDDADVLARMGANEIITFWQMVAHRALNGSSAHH